MCGQFSAQFSAQSFWTRVKSSLRSSRGTFPLKSKSIYYSQVIKLWCVKRASLNFTKDDYKARLANVIKRRSPVKFSSAKKKNAEYGACLVCSLTHTSHQTIQQEVSILPFADPLTPLAHQRRNCNKVSQLRSVINNKGNSIRPNVMCSFNVQGHRTTVSTLTL